MGFLYESLGELRKQEAAYAYYQLACYQRDCCLKFSELDMKNSTLSRGENQRIKQYASLADRNWQKSVDFYGPGTHPLMYFTILMERSTLFLNLSSFLHSNMKTSNGSLIHKDIPSWSTMPFVTIMEEIKLIKNEALENCEPSLLHQLTDENSWQLLQKKLGSVDLVVDLDDDMEIIIGHLTRGTKQLDIVSIVGMPGLGLSIAPRDLALLCQKVENHVVGAPCGVMDQIASACGEANKLLAMVCQPAEVLGLVDIPPHIRFWGIDSGIRHSVVGADYGSVRVGAFMGRKIVKSTASGQISLSISGNNPSPQLNGNTLDEREKDGKNLLETEASLDYLCNLSPHRYEASYIDQIPEFLQGQDFLDKYVNHEDSVTVIDKKQTYAVRAPTKHPIYENFRVKAFKALLSATPSEDQLSSLGEIMYQCHYSYSHCGLGSDGTDRLVELVQQLQHCKLSKPQGGTLFGAKITGGGSGGTVCVIGRNLLRSSEQILEIQHKYKAATGFLPFIFEGSSPGAGKFGYLRIRLRSCSRQ